ncbi:hypothetical protein K7X08_021810 [Anisodus acutangulus]|uniref:Uncharacterized protein n=1 Tax=Anisodus acutangulus TaxID=402998 RepID=A0A9Q1QUP2_9SOLA|nr:hypothetical protein K7X08_021810 [Anisodus acutangulus]
MEDDMAEATRGFEQLYMPRRITQAQWEEIEQYAEGTNKETNKFAALGDGEENNSEENPGSNTTSGAAEPVQKSSDTNKIVKEASGKNMTKEWVHRTFTVPEGDSSSKQQMVTTNKSNENATEVPESHDTRDPGPDDNTANTPDIVAKTEITESSNLGNQNAIIEVIETDEDFAIQVEDVGKEGNANVNAMANTDTIMTINPSTTEAEDIVIEEESNLRDVIKAKETPIVADAGSGRKQQLKDNSKKGSKGTREVINIIHKQHKNTTKTGRSGNLDTVNPVEAWSIEEDICRTHVLNTLQGVVLALAQPPAMYTIHGKCNRSLGYIQPRKVTLSRKRWLMQKSNGANTEKSQAMITIQRGVTATFQEEQHSSDMLLQEEKSKANFWTQTEHVNYGDTDRVTLGK